MRSPSVITGSGPTMRRYRAVIGWVAVLAPTPYIVVKVAWISGSSAGITDPALLADPAYRIANLASIAADLIAVAVALALTRRFGRGLPAPLLLAPMWVATGFLAPIIILTPAGAQLANADSAQGLSPWVYVVVYASFTTQGLTLLAAFGLYAADRWGRLKPARSVNHPSTQRLITAICLLGCLALSASYLCWTVGIAYPPGRLYPVDRLTLGVYSLFALVAAAGVATIGRPAATAAQRWSALAALWLGSSSMFSWGAYYLALAAWRPDQATPQLAAAACIKVALSIVLAAILVARFHPARPAPPTVDLHLSG